MMESLSVISMGIESVIKLLRTEKKGFWLHLILVVTLCLIKSKSKVSFAIMLLKSTQSGKGGKACVTNEDLRHRSCTQQVFTQHRARSALHILTSSRKNGYSTLHCSTTFFTVILIFIVSGLMLQHTY